MPKIKTVWGLLAFVSGLVITLLGVAYVGQLGVVAVIFGEYIAYAYVYPIISIALQVLSYIAVIAIIYLIGWAVCNYFRNRGKLDEPSAELNAINELGIKLDKLIELMENHYGTTNKPK